MSTIYIFSGRSISVRQSAVLDFELLQLINMTEVLATIVVTDGFKTSSSSVTIRIIDVNEPPVCSASRYYFVVNSKTVGLFL